MSDNVKFFLCDIYSEYIGTFNAEIVWVGNTHHHMIELKQRGQLICQVCIKKSVKNTLTNLTKNFMGAVHTATFCSHRAAHPTVHHHFI